MPPIQVQAPDGSIVEFPEGTPDATIEQVMAREYRAPDFSDGRGIDVYLGVDEAEHERQPQGEANQMLGFVQGMASTVEDANRNLPFNLIPGTQWFKDLAQQTIDEALQREIAKAAERGERPGQFGETIGRMTMALPYAALGGPATGGGIQGYATSQRESVAGRLGDAAIGAVGGKAGQKGVEFAGSALRGVTDPAVSYLAQRGVQLTPGQTLGGVARWLEDRATSYPVVGPAIDRARTRAVETFNRGAINEALAPIGLKLPDNIRTGQEAVEWAGDQLSRRYDEITPNLSLRVDPKMVAQLRRIGVQMQDVPEDMSASVMRQLGRLTRFRPDVNGVMTGAAVRRADSEFGTRAANYMRSPMASEKEAGDLMLQIQQLIRDGLERQNPDATGALAATNQAFRNMVPIEYAAGSAGAREGMVTPRQLRAGSRAADRSPRKRQTARGRAPMQRYAQEGEKVLTTLPNSGTADRLNAGNPAAWMIGALARLGYGGAEAASKVATAPRDDLAIALAREIKRLERPAGLFGSTFAAQQSAAQQAP